jgi:hypothetical protein
MKTTARELFPYGAHSAMNVVGVYNVEVMVSTGISVKNEEFVLLTGEGLLLLEKKNTVKRLGMLKVTFCINQDPVSVVKVGFPTLRKIKNFQLQILISPFVKPEV